MQMYSANNLFCKRLIDKVNNRSSPAVFEDLVEVAFLVFSLTLICISQAKNLFSTRSVIAVIVVVLLELCNFLFQCRTSSLNFKIFVY